MKKTRTQRILAFVMCLFLLAGPSSGLLMLTAFAAPDALEPSNKLKITLTWKSGGTGVESSSNHNGKQTVIARVKVEGDSSQTVSVTMSTIDLSARAVSGWEGSEYRPVEKTFTIQGGSYADFEVEVYNMKRYESDGTMSNNYAPAVQVNGTLYRHQVGIQIVDHSDNAYVSGTRTLRAYVNVPNADKWVLATTKNSSVGHYPYSNSAYQKALHDKGYSFTGAVNRVESTSYSYKNKNGKTNGVWVTVKADGDMPGGSGYRLNHRKNDDGFGRAQFTFSAPHAILRDSKNHRELMDIYPNLKVYISGNFRVHKESSGVHNDPLVIKLDYAGNIGSTSDIGGHREISDGSLSNRKLIHWFPNGKSISRGGSYSGWKEVSDNGKGWTMDAENRDGQSGNNKIIMNLNMGVALVEETRPTVSEIYVSQNKTYASAAEDLFLMVRMSEPVQLHNINGFSVSAQVKDGDTTVGSTVIFHYVDGNYTDTLIFKANLTDAEAQKLYGNKLRISDINYDGKVEAADLFVNTSCINNEANFQKTTSGGNVTGMMVDCMVDARVPKIDLVGEMPTAPAKAHTANIKITNMQKGGKVRYAWSAERNIHNVTSGWKDIHDADLKWNGTTSTATVKGEGLNGDMYLHVIATSAAGVSGYKTIKLGDSRDYTFRFDNTSPVIESVSGHGQTHNRYSDKHTIAVRITDPQTSKPSERSEIKKVWIYVKGPNGLESSGGEILVYGGSDDKMTFDPKTNVFTMTLTYSLAGVPKDSYGAYSVYVMAEDASGNRTSYDKAYKLPSPLMFDSRDKFGISHEASYDAEGGFPEEARIPADHMPDGYTVYYNYWREECLRIAVNGLDTGSSADVYELYSIMRDGELIYDREEGGWTDGYSEAHPDGSKRIYHPDHLTLTGPLNMDNRMMAVIFFSDRAVGRYDFVFIKNSGQQSEILSVYVTPQDGEPTNYKELGNDERLPINRVWQFSTAQFYKGNATRGVGYDGLAQNAAKPIFSSYEKAYEYARFTEAQDLELFYIDPADPNAPAITQYLNDNNNTTYRKAAGETTEAKVGQTWIRYKSAYWTPKDGADSSTLWVYYYYDEDKKTLIEVNDYMDLGSVNAVLENALRDNASEIANKDGTWVYLTADAKGSVVDGYGQPSYSKAAIFYDDVVLDVSESNFVRAFTYEGDRAMYSSRVTVAVQGEDQRIPLVGNYTFEVRDYHQTYYRKSGDTEWLAVEDGQNIRTFGGSGVYELMEVGSGYRHYYIYCDFDAPRVHYTFTKPGEDTPTTEKNQFFFGTTTFRAKALTLEYFLDISHALEGVPMEMDAYSYLYITRNAGGGMVEETVQFFTMEDLHALEGGFDLPNGIYHLHVYDRLGNTYTITVNANSSQLIVQEPVVEENTSVTFYINRDKNEIESFKITRLGAKSEEVDTAYAKVKEYVKSGVYTLEVSDIFGNAETRTVTLERDPPDVQFYYKNGAGKFQALEVLDVNAATPQGYAALRQVDEDVYALSSSVPVRISYSSYARYRYELTPAIEGFRETTTANSTILEVPVSDVPWTLTVCYANDEDTKVTITCINDSDPPTVTAKATLSQYTFHDASGYGNVLFSPRKTDGGGNATRTVTIPTGTKINAQDISLTWDDGTDGSGVEMVSYTHNDGKPVFIDTNEQDGLIVSEPGRYVLTVVDLLNNTNEFVFTIADTPDVLVTLADGTPIPLPTDPLSHTEGGPAHAVFTETTYTGQGFSMHLREDMTVTFYRRTSKTETPTVYEIQYAGTQLTARRYEAENGYVDLPAIALDASAGTSETGVFGFLLRYTYAKDGLHLDFPAAVPELEEWQFRFTDPFLSAPHILQMERSNVTPDMTVIKADSLTVMGAQDKTYTGINEGFTLTGDTRDVVSVIAYRASFHTFDFSHVSEANTYNMVAGGLVSVVDDEGYYKVVVTNKYGNTQIFYLRVNFSADMDVVISYADFETREHIVSGQGTYEYFTNDSIILRVWNLKTVIEVTKDGTAYNPITRADSSCIELTFKENGHYTVIAKDDFGSTFILKLDIRAPRDLAYDEYLTDFNPDALERDKQYTNAPVSLDRDALDRSGIAYVAYVATGSKDTPTVLYDIISYVQVPYSEENFLRSIGRKNGSYTVTFADRYGNTVQTEVHISDTARLFVSRNTKNSAGNMDYAMDSVMAGGVWSNYIVRLRNEASAYKLWVDGVEAFFNANNEYLCELPLTLGDTAEAEHTILYMDSYGNRYEFTIHLYRHTPAITSMTDGEELVKNGTLYVKGSFGFSWEDAGIMATYTMSGQSTPLSYTAGTLLEQDGSYTFTFTDRAGNMETRRIVRDTAVVYALVHANQTVQSGIAVSGQIRVNEDGESITIIEALKNGEPFTPEGHVFKEHGSYILTLADEVGNIAVVSFDIFNDPMQAFTYVSKGEYALYQVWYYIEGVRQPSNGIMLNEEGYQEFAFFEEGRYDVELLHVPTNTYFTYELEIDNTPPAVTLVGDMENGVTRSDLRLEGLERDNVVEIWINGELVDTYRIGTNPESPVLKKPGDYRVVIRDLAGNETVHTFVREFTTNTAANVLICLMMLSVAVGCALFLHTRGRFRVK